MLLFARPEMHAEIRAALSNLVHVAFNFDEAGSKIVLYQPNGL
jgi:D-glycero-alpha-D-manno-heptose-7-phosphate kinase